MQRPQNPAKPQEGRSALVKYFSSRSVAGLATHLGTTTSVGWLLEPKVTDKCNVHYTKLCLPCHGGKINPLYVRVYSLYIYGYM